MEATKACRPVHNAHIEVAAGISLCRFKDKEIVEKMKNERDSEDDSEAEMRIP